MQHTEATLEQEIERCRPWLILPRAIYSGLDTIVEMQESAEHFAKMNGCAMMSVSGRKGWQRVLGKHGYGNTLTVLEKRIS